MSLAIFSTEAEVDEDAVNDPTEFVPERWAAWAEGEFNNLLSSFTVSWPSPFDSI